MKRRAFLLAAGAVATPFTAFTQTRDRPARIATLDPGGERDQAQLWEKFRKRMQELGYAEGKGFVIERRWANSELSRLPALAAELVMKQPDVIVTTNT